MHQLTKRSAASSFGRGHDISGKSMYDDISITTSWNAFRDLRLRQCGFGVVQRGFRAELVEPSGIDAVFYITFNSTK